MVTLGSPMPSKKHHTHNKTEVYSDYSFFRHASDHQSRSAPTSSSVLRLGGGRDGTTGVDEAAFNTAGPSS